MVEYCRFCWKIKSRILNQMIEFSIEGSYFLSGSSFCIWQILSMALSEKDKTNGYPWIEPYQFMSSTQENWRKTISQCWFLKASFISETVNIEFSIVICSIYHMHSWLYLLFIYFILYSSTLLLICQNKILIVTWNFYFVLISELWGSWLTYHNFPNIIKAR